jgi:hypothetical protein
MAQTAVDGKKGETKCPFVNSSQNRSFFIETKADDSKDFIDLSNKEFEKIHHHKHQHHHSHKGIY